MRAANPGASAALLALALAPLAAWGAGLPVPAPSAAPANGPLCAVDGLAGTRLGANCAPADAPVLTRPYLWTDAIIPNPERGFYSYITLIEDRDHSGVLERGHRLVYSNIRLDEFRDAPISQDFLNEVVEGFEALRTAGLKAVIRFAYNAGPYPDSEPDASKARILEHIAQLEPILRAQADVLALVQAGFIGAWGEWHTSTNGLLDDPQDRRDILEALLNALPADRATQVRRPTFKQEMYGGPLTEAQAYTGSYAARTGHHNDCFLSSNTDSGTYPSNAIEQWKDYVAGDTRFVAMGGETCERNPPRSSCQSALQEMERLHYSYLNNDYHPDVIQDWINEGCFGEMERRLGYRLVLDDADLPPALKPGGRFRFRLALHNEGWAAPINPRPVILVLSGGATRHQVRLEDVDLRRWAAGEASEVQAHLEVPAALPEGRYQLALWLPDADTDLRDRSDYSIRFANDGVWDGAAGSQVLGTIEVTRSAPGTSNPEAQGFSVLDE